MLNVIVASFLASKLHHLISHCNLSSYNFLSLFLLLWAVTQIFNLKNKQKFIYSLLQFSHMFLFYNTHIYIHTGRVNLNLYSLSHFLAHTTLLSFIQLACGLLSISRHSPGFLTLFNIIILVSSFSFKLNQSNSLFAHRIYKRKKERWQIDVTLFGRLFQSTRRHLDSINLFYYMICSFCFLLDPRYGNSNYPINDGYYC